MLEGLYTLCVGECKTVQPLWKTVWRFLKRKGIEMPYDPAIALVGICLKKRKTLIQTDICRLLVTAAFFTTVKTEKQPQSPSADERIKEGVAHTLSSIAQPEKKE